MSQNIKAIGSNLVLRIDGEQYTFVATGQQLWLPTRQIVVAPPEPDPEPEPEPDPGTPPAGDGKWGHPLPQGRVTSPYGYRGAEFHAGMDISSVGGTGPGNNVLAPFDMEITQSWEAGTGGLAAAGSFVKGITRSGPEYTISFFHMHPGTLKVTKGQIVGRGHVLGTEGNSGNSFGTHCHIEMWPGHRRAGFSVDGPWYYGDGTPIDPRPIFIQNGVNL